MLGHSKPIPFDPYGSRRRSRKRFPGWLLLLLSGIAIGAGGVVYVQERHLPPRLSAAESTRLQDAYAKADRRGGRCRSWTYRTPPAPIAMPLSSRSSQPGKRLRERRRLP